MLDSNGVITMKYPDQNFVSKWIAGAIAFGGIGVIALYSGAPSHADAAEGSLDIFTQQLQNGWQDWSWAVKKMPDSSHLYKSLPSIEFVPSNWKGIYFHHDSIPADSYQTLSFLINGGDTGGQKIQVCVVRDAGAFGRKLNIADMIAGKSIPAGKFAQVEIPMNQLEDTNTPITGICFMDASGKEQLPVYLANIKLTGGKQADFPAKVDLRVDISDPIGPISPYIYGMSHPDTALFSALHLPLWRWGGNENTRYNWSKGNAWNKARDWYWHNYGSDAKEGSGPSSAADAAIQTAKSAGAASFITIPTIGWVASDNVWDHMSLGVPAEGGPPISAGSEAIAGYDPAENRNRVSLKSLPKKPGPFQDPPDIKQNTVYQDEWIYHLIHKFGKAYNGGVKFYAMDNEPDLWDSTHTDIHPVQPDYEELLNKFTTYADAVKDVDSTALITGPVSWGWTGYFFSPRDKGTDKFASHADRKAHGDIPFIPWFLKQTALHDRKTGRRSLDILDVHFYPQGSGVYEGKTDPASNALRLRSTRALWDSTYKDESWINTEVQLLPRLHAWIDENYPGTKIGINEWNWGADNTINGALATAEVLGIMGREKVFMACYWTAPKINSPGFYAYKMYLNANDAGGGFGDSGVKASSSDQEHVSCFGSIDKSSGQPAIMMLNKMESHSVSANLTISGSSTTAIAEVFRYSSDDLNKIVKVGEMPAAHGNLQIQLPPYSITLLRMKSK